MTDSERAAWWLQRDANRRVNLALDRIDGVIPGMWGDTESITSLAALLKQVRAEENEACAALVETERGEQIERAAVAKVKGGRDDVVLVRMSKDFVEEMGARDSGGWRLSYVATPNADGTHDLRITRTDDGFVERIQSEARQEGIEAERRRRAVGDDLAAAP